MTDDSKPTQNPNLPPGQTVEDLDVAYEFGNAPTAEDARKNLIPVPGGARVITTETALLLIESVRSALQNGVKHFSRDGRPLTTEHEVISALARDGEVILHDG